MTASRNQSPSAAGTGRPRQARRRRVLTIALHFPPANQTATRRVLKFVRYLPERGWESTVVTVRHHFHRQRDQDGMREVPPGTRIHRAFGFDPRVALSIRGRYPGLLALPDRAASWLPFATLEALHTIRGERIDAILSTSPPVTAHCIGLLLKRITKLPWVVDFRDPWSTHRRGPVEAALDRRLEDRVVRAADHILVTTGSLAGDLGHRHGDEVAAKTTVVHNGYDDEDFRRLARPIREVERFSIAHVGQLGGTQRDPTPFLRALRHCLDRELIPLDPEVVLVGSGESADCGELQALAQSLGLERAVRIVPHLGYLQALEAMLRSSALLLLQPGELYRMCIPAKAFEYLRSGRRILTIAPAGSETAKLMRGFAGVEIAAPSDPGDIADKLVATYHAWRHQGDPGQRDLGAYDRRSLTGKLAAILDAVCDRRGAEAPA